MSTVVQTSYRPQIAKGVAGLVVDEGGYETATRRCDTSAGITFGQAVSDGGDGTAVLGGDSFLGITCRDVTLNGVSLLPLADAATAADTFERYRNMPVLTRGRIYVQADCDVAAGDPIYYDHETGMLGNSASGSSAYGNIQFSGQPAVNDTITFNGTAITFVASTPTATHVVIGPTLAATIEALVTTLNASTDGGIDVATYEAYPPSPGGAGQGSGAYQLNIGYTTPGAAGNGYTLTKSCAAATLSAANLAGGYGGTDAGGSIVFVTNPGPALAATGNIVFTTNPGEGTKITLMGHDVVFKGTPGAGEIQIGIDLATTLDTLVVALNNEAVAPGNNVDIKKATYTATGTPHATLHIVYDTAVTAGNGFTTATNVSGATPSGAHLTGGLDPQTITLGGTLWTFVASGQSGQQSNIGVDLATTLATLKSRLNASVETNTALCTYDTTGTPATTLTITDKVPSPAGDAFTVTTDIGDAAASGTTLGGGIVPSVAVADAWWATSAQVGDLAIVSLGVQS